MVVTILLATLWVCAVVGVVTVARDTRRAVRRMRPTAAACHGSILGLFAGLLIATIGGVWIIALGSAHMLCAYTFAERDMPQRTVTWRNLWRRRKETR